ncbi:MAG: sulfotransferase domain-containing protein [Steroidobacteraceae bacterium]
MSESPVPSLGTPLRPGREVRNHTLDSRRWNEYSFRGDDIVIATWAKTGTTWLQQILAQLVLAPAEPVALLELSPWIEQRCFPLQPILARLESQGHRRFVKTHLPADALPMSPLARYIYVGRDGRDALWSWYNHHRQLTREGLAFINAGADRVGPPLGPASTDVRQYFLAWLERNGFPLWPFWAHVQSWWDRRDRPNVLLAHFNRLKADTAAEIRRIARFLEMELDESRLPEILHRCSFDYMRTNASTLSPNLEGLFKGGAQAFVYKGTNGRWHDVLTADDLRRYQTAVRRNLSPDCARWLATGDLPVGVSNPP